MDIENETRASGGTFRSICLILLIPAAACVTLGAAQLRNIWKYGIDNVPVVMTDAEACYIRDQAMLRADYEQGISQGKRVAQMPTKKGGS